MMTNRMTKRIFLPILFMFSVNAYAQGFDSLALTPPMGWNSWNHYGWTINEQIVRNMANAMVSSGMKAAGYQYINLDDSWEGWRDSLGYIHADSIRFPHGIKALADYVHSLGLKMGIYSSAGPETCYGRPGSEGHEYQDARTYAEWGIDYLKYDWCYAQGLNPEAAYDTMANALRAAGRPIVYSIACGGLRSSSPWVWASKIGNLWRTTGDISANWDRIMQIIDEQSGLRKYAGPGHWNDPDMMEVGNLPTVGENRAHFSMWCMLAAPLIAGNDLTSMSQATKDILTNKAVIAVDQDSLGIEGFKYSSNDSVDIWFKPLERGDWAMCALNRSLTPKEVDFDWQNENVMDSLSGRDAMFSKIIYRILNLWTDKSLGNTDRPLVAEVPGHDVLMLRLIKNFQFEKYALPDSDQVLLQFTTDLLNPVSNITHIYLSDPGVAVSCSVDSLDNSVLHVRTSSPLLPNKSYTLYVEHLLDVNHDTVNYTLTFSYDPAGAPLEVDDATPSKFMTMGYPWISVNDTGAVGGSCRIIKQSTSVVRAQWGPFQVYQDGYYDVYASVPQVPYPVSDKCLYLVLSQNGSDSVITSQQLAVNGWLRLGNFEFSAGQVGAVMVSSVPGADTSQYLVADAVMLKSSVNISGVEGRSLAPLKFQLEQNYPNPFNPATVISYQLSANSYVTLKVYDVLGRVVATLVNGREDAGSHMVTFDASRLPSGVYFYRLDAGDYSAVKKMLLLK